MLHSNALLLFYIMEDPNHHKAISYYCLICFSSQCNQVAHKSNAYINLSPMLSDISTLRRIYTLKSNAKRLLDLSIKHKLIQDHAYSSLTTSLNEYFIKRSVTQQTINQIRKRAYAYHLINSKLLRKAQDLIIMKIDSILICKSLESLYCSTTHDTVIELAKYSIVAATIQIAQKLIRETSLFQNIEKLSIVDVQVDNCEARCLTELANDVVQLSFGSIVIRKFKF